MTPAWAAPGSRLFDTLWGVKSSIGVVLFFLLSGFFLSTLLGTLERSRRLLGVGAACLVAVVCVIVFLTPVRLPAWRLGADPKPVSTSVAMSTSTSTSAGTTSASTTSSTISTSTNSIPSTLTPEASSVEAR